MMIDSLEIVKRQLIIGDSGPIYNEFIHDAVVHEPWNAYSSLFFFIPVIYWVWRLKGEYRNHKILVAVLPLLFLNGLGSTLFHAFRSHQFFLLLDGLPGSLMSITLSTYFWTRIVKKWYFGFLCVLGFYGLAVLTIFGLSGIPGFRYFALNIGYFFVGCSLLIPVLIQLYRLKFKLWESVVLTLFFLIVALVFRSLDYPTANPFPETLPQGTHFLWHIFSSLAVFSLGFFIYSTNHYERTGRFGSLFKEKE
jgi:hemolysin III